MYELRHLRSFVILADEMHFGRAAQRLFITQPALSAQIARFEQDIGVRLFERSRRHIELTDSGRALLPRARTAIELADEGVQGAIHASSAETGVIDVAYAPAAAYDVLPWLLRDWTREYPRIQLSLREMTTGDQVPALLARELQVGIVQSQLNHPKLSRRVIRCDPAVVALPATHRLAQCSAIDITDLGEEYLMVLPRTAAPAFCTVLEEAFDKSNVPVLNDVHGGLPRILAMVSAGQGVGLTHAGLTSWRPPGVSFVPLAVPLTIDTAVAWRTESTSKLVTKLIDWLAAHKDQHSATNQRQLGCG